MVDIWAGFPSEKPGEVPWAEDTLVDVFSVGKGMVSLALLTLVDSGHVDLEAPVARYWPEFAEGGKGEITVRTLLGHRAGLPAVRRRLPDDAIYNWTVMTAALADQEPWWKPGTKHGYHVNTFGFLVGEIVGRVSGQSFGAYFRSQIAEPLGADFHFGVRPEDEARLAEFVWGSREKSSRASDVEPELAEDDEERRLLLQRAYFNPPGISGLGVVNTSAWRAAEIPSANAHSNARAIARIYSALACGGSVDGVQVLAPETIALATEEQSAGQDEILARPSRFGLGFQLTQPERPLGPNPGSFGHFGVGGSLGFADPEARLAFGYTVNKAGARWQNPRNRALVDAVYACL